MIRITIYQDKEEIKRFTCLGHAGYADYGNDIVCAAVSVLVINTINSIEALTDAKFEVSSDEETGNIDFSFSSHATSAAKLLVSSMVLGLQGIQNDYGKEFLTLDFKEV